jgi:hypothetical protein|tara:strand:- start:2135 stop:2350 length:216 start_codon:yes stop_codon:yes gene_type:complete
MTLLQEFKQFKTLKEKRLFALKHAKSQYNKEMLSYEKLSSFSIHCLFYISIGKKYTHKRKYIAKHNKEREF